MKHLTAQTGPGRRLRNRSRGPNSPMMPLEASGRRIAAGGFTLTEALLAMVIVGTGILASLQLFGVCTEENQAASRATTARMLADNVREAMAAAAFCDPVSAATVWGPEPGENLAQYDDVDDFDGPAAKGMTFNPPIDATRNPIAALGAYSQVVSIMPVDPNDPGANDDEANPTLPKGAYTGAVRVRVKVLYTKNGQSTQMYSTSWVRVNN